MSEEHTNYLLDIEFKRYIQIMKPYMKQLVYEDTIDLCHDWIRRLSECDEREKNTRNKYAFTLCQQLAKGILAKPFLQPPPKQDLPCLDEASGSDCSSDLEYFISSEDRKTQTLYNNKKPAIYDTDLDTQDNEDEDEKRSSFDGLTRSITSSEYKSRHLLPQTAYMCPLIYRKKNNFNEKLQPHPIPPGEGEYEFRATNLVKRLRAIKKQNMLLHRELTALKEEANKPLSGRSEKDCTVESLVKLDIATNTHIECDQAVKELAEEKEKNNFLVGKVEGLQEQLSFYNDMRRQDMEDLIAQHKQEIIKIKQNILEECSKAEKEHVHQIQQEYDTKILNLKCAHEQEIEVLKQNYEKQLHDIEDVVQVKENEIKNLKTVVADTDRGVNLKTLLDKILEKPNESLGAESEKLKVQELEKRLTKMEKAKAKCVKLYESKIASLERDKHLSECSIQLQLARQRTKVVNEITDENQAEMSSALNTLEAKYKDIVASVQATAIQRRMQDQVALESILHAACSLNINMSNCAIRKPFSTNTNDPQRDPRGYETDVAEFLRQYERNHSSKAYDSDVAGYCLAGERLGELFQKAYIPQRDTGDTAKKLH